MAVAFDARTTNRRTGTSDPHTFNHTPSGTPRGVLLVFAQATGSSSDIDTISYGSASMSRVGTVAADTAGETGTAEVWFVGTSIPAGMQIVTINFVSAAPTDDYGFLCVTVTAAADTEIVDSGVAEENQADPSIVLSYGGRTCLTVGALHSGRGTETDISWDAGHTDEDGFINGAGSTTHVARQTTAGSSDFTFGATVVSDDVAMAAACIAEVQATGVIMNQLQGANLGADLYNGTLQ